MYIVRNTTGKTILLSDIRAIIGPYKLLDLEKVVDYQDIEKSCSLHIALKKRDLQLVRKTAIPIATTKIIHVNQISEDPFDEKKLKNLIREVLHEKKDHDIEGTIHNAVNKSIQPLIESIRDKIYAPYREETSKINDPEIDLEQLAIFQQAAIEKVSEGIEDQRIKQGKRIRLKNLDPAKLANEL